MKVVLRLRSGCNEATWDTTALSDAVLRALNATITDTSQDKVRVSTSQNLIVVSTPLKENANVEPRTART